MKLLLKLALWSALITLGAVALIKVLYGVSWDEAVEIADRFVEDLVA